MKRWRLLAALLCAFSGAAHANVTAHKNARWVFDGDSTIAGTSDQNNTSWPFCPGGLVAQINAQLGTTQVGNRRVGGGLGAFPKVGGVQARAAGGALVTFNNGTSGFTWASVDAAKAQILVLAPDVYVVNAGINDADLGVDPAVTRTHIDSVLDYVQANLPSTQIMVVAPGLNGELWLPGPPRFNNSHDAAIDATTAQIQASAVAHGVTFVPLRPALLVYEQANNLTPVDHGYIMDSLLNHPTYPTSQLGPTSGMELIANQVMSFVTVSP